MVKGKGKGVAKGRGRGWGGAGGGGREAVVGMDPVVVILCLLHITQAIYGWFCPG